MRRSALATFVLACSWFVAPGAQRAPAPASGTEQTPVFRLSVSLVQLDAVVTDRKGHHFTTLGPTDFDVYQDGLPQPVTAVNYVDAEERWEDTSGLPPLQTGAARPRDGRRAVAIIVDDLRMSFDSVYRARFGLEQFVDRQFRPGDVAMLSTTSGGGQADRAFTVSPIVLKSEVRRLRYGRASLNEARGVKFERPPTLFDLNQDHPVETDTAVRAIERVSAAVDALRDAPGRKLVILVSEGFSLYGGGRDDLAIREALQRLVDRSNRAGVVVYAIDPRGVVVAGLTAGDNAAVEGGQAVVAALRETQGDLRFVAGQTGGFAVINNNNLGSGFERIMADQRGYYLIGYQPAPGTIDTTGRAFRKVDIRVKRKGLTVRSRAGFYGIATE